MIKLLIFILINLLAGFVFLRIFNKKDLFNAWETMGISFGIGFGLNSLFVFLTSWLGITISAKSILISLALFICSGLYFLRRREELGLKDLRDKIFALLGRRFDLVDFGLVGLSGAIWFSVFYSAVGFSFTDWDEYSFWGVASKAIFLNRSINLNDMVSTMETYPLFLPLTAGSTSIFTGQFSENIIRTLTPLFLFFICIYLFGFFQRMGMNFKEKFLFSFLLPLSAGAFTHLSTMLYADIPFAYFYTVAVLLFLLNIINKNSEKSSFYLISGIFFGLASWAKLEGLQVSLITIAFLFFVKFIFSRREALIKGTGFFYGFLAMPFLWSFYKKINNLQTIGTPKLFENTGFALANLDTIIGKMYIQATDPRAWGNIWQITLLVFVLSLIFFRKNKLILIISFLLGLNMLYLFSAYLFYFSQQEILAASSFGRYLTHYFPLACVVIGLFYMELKEKSKATALKNI